MKKLIVFLAVALLSVSITISAYAQTTPIREGAEPAQPVENTNIGNELADEALPEADVPVLPGGAYIPEEELLALQRNADEIDMSDEELMAAQRLIDGDTANELRLDEGVAGRGTVDNPADFWVMNGYPDNISFAYEAGGEILENGASIAYWEIGIVNGSEADKQEILGLISPNCLVTFKDCSFSYNQRLMAYNEISAGLDEIVRQVVMALNSETVVVEIADGYEKDYAQKYIEVYGAFVTVTNSIPSNANATAIGGSLPQLEGGFGESGFNNWIWLICSVFLVIAFTVLFVNRTRFIPALQTNNGNIITKGAPVSRKQTITAIKNSVISPSDDVFDSLKKRIDNLK